MIWKRQMKRFLGKPSVCSVYLGPSWLVVKDVYYGKYITGGGLVVSFTEDFREGVRVDWPKIAFSPNWD